MPKPEPVNGHRSWSAYNVYTWIMNDEHLYSLALHCLANRRDIKRAAWYLQSLLPTATPDKARYSVSSLVSALKEIKG